jgi:hypothetical protein
MAGSPWEKQMTTFVLTFDLCVTENTERYESLLDELARLKAHRHQLSAWLINLNTHAKAAHDHFKALVRDDDSLWVSEVTNKNYYSGVRRGTNRWMRENTPPPWRPGI